MIRRLIICIFLLQFCYAHLNAQSKTEEVEQKVEDGNDDNESNESSFLSELGFEFIFDISTYLLFGYRDPVVTPLMGYNPYPFYTSEYMNSRSVQSNKKYSLQFQLDYASPPFTEVDRNIGIQAHMQYGFNGLIGEFRQWNEKGSSIPMRSGVFAYLRQMRFFPRSTAKVLIGYQRFEVGRQKLDGLVFGFKTDYYLLKPISFLVNHRWYIYDQFESYKTELGLRYHIKQHAITLKHLIFDFEGITFKSINVGYQFYF